MELIQESFSDIIEKSLGKKVREAKIPLKRGYMSKISMIGEQTDVFMVFNRAFLLIASQEMLFEENPDEQTLEDIARELANLTVGRAKVIAQEENRNFNISTPTYLGHRIIKTSELDFHFKFQGGRCSIYVKHT